MKLYNTLTRSVEPLQPLHDKIVKLYTCGLTVYSQPHIGNWLGYVYWDVLVRALRAEGYTVEHTQNITDVGHLTSDDDNGEDKMEKGAKREGITAWDVAAKYIAIAATEATQLGLTPPTHLVRATDMIPQQIAFAQVLDKKGYLYEIPGDGMYFDTSKLTDYGKLAQLDISGLEAGARVSVAGKRNITDFAVWKFSPEGTKRDMEWGAPWGNSAPVGEESRDSMGFPGWHLECSVIARETLGDQIDIHTGGIDHIPVHHTNEIAQTEAVTGQTFSQLWLHVNHLKADGKKMSKSLGNIYTLQDIIDKGYSLDAFKVFALGKHYRTEGNFTWENLEAAANRLHNYCRAVAHIWQPQAMGGILAETSAQTIQQLHDALEDDLDTPQALTILNEYFTALEKEGVSYNSLDECMALLETVEKLLGLRLKVPDISAAQKTLIEERNRARDNKDWERSDQLRDTLIAQGITLQDTPHGIMWYWL